MKHGRDQKNFTEMMCELLRQQALTELEIDTFDGNPMDIHYFMTVLKTAIKSIGLPSIVENKVTDPREWLTCLIKFTKGEAKEIAKNCIEIPWVQDCQTTAH